MIARVREAGRRLALGTGLLLHGAGDWLAPADSGTKFLARSGGALAGLVFAGPLLERAPHLIVGVPVGWAVAAWHVSDSSATPPPEGGPPSGAVFAAQTERVDYVEWSPDGVRCTIHPIREEVNGE